MYGELERHRYRDFFTQTKTFLDAIGEEFIVDHQGDVAHSVELLSTALDAALILVDEHSEPDRLMEATNAIELAVAELHHHIDATF